VDARVVVGDVLLIADHELVQALSDGVLGVEDADLVVAVVGVGHEPAAHHRPVLRALAE